MHDGKALKEALAKELEETTFFHDGLSGDLHEARDKAEAYVQGFQDAADVIRSFDLTPFEVKAESLAAQLAERDKRIAKMRSGEFICTECLLRKNAEVPQADF
jgi:hypothetical protein